MTTPATGAQAEKQGQSGKVIGWVSSWSPKVFALNPQGLNWARGVAVLDVLLIPLIVFG